MGTPGRVKDFLEKGTLRMDNIKFRVLDECDEMLNMGFAEDVEKIIGAIPDPSRVQTLLFSATLPPWVKGIANKYLKEGHHTVDMVGTDRMKASTAVQHLVLPCLR